MTDDKTERAVEIAKDFTRALKECYEMLTDEPPTPEDARGMAQTALNRAVEVVYPRYSTGARGGGKGVYGQSSDEKPYEQWTNPPSEGQLKRLRVVTQRMLERYGRDEATRDDAAGALRGFMEAVWTARWEGELPEHYSRNDTTLTGGQVSYLMDKAEEAFPGLMDKGGK